jgi:ABC-2 type transport system ATP-binding protein
MIRLENVSKSYSKSGVKAVDRLSLHVKPGEIFGFIGPNGAGKTTTIKMMTGLLKMDEGSIFIRDVDLRQKPVEAKRLIGFVPDSQYIYERLTGLEYLHFIADMYSVGSKERKERIEKYLSMFELTGAARDMIKSYSHGMKQKLIIASALLHSPPLWVLDEPMVGLDPKSSHLLKQEMHEHTASGNTVFFSTHILEVAEKLCDRIGIIDHGRLIAAGTMEELRSGVKDETLENLFLKLTEDAEGGRSR